MGCCAAQSASTEEVRMEEALAKSQEDVAPVVQEPPPEDDAKPIAGANEVDNTELEKGPVEAVSVVSEPPPEGVEMVNAEKADGEKADAENVDTKTVDAEKAEGEKADAEKVVKPSVELTFKESDKKAAATKTFVFYINQPGIDLSKKMPMKVTGCKKQTPAEAAGVKKGMVLTTVAGQDITGLKYTEANELLQKSMKELPEKEAVVEATPVVSDPKHIATVVEEVKPAIQPIELIFKVSDKKDAEAKSFVFSVNNPGIDFSKKMPMKVTGCKKRTAAESAGVKKGMVLTTVAGQDITCLQYSEANALFQKVMNELPAP